MLKKNEPEWPIIDWTAFEQQQASAGESVPYWAWKRAVELTGPNRSSSQVLHDFARYIAAHEPKGEVPKLLTEAGLRKILTEEGGVAGWRQDRIVRGFKARALLAPEPEPDALREVAEELARESQDLNLPLRKRVDWFEAALRERNLIAPEPEPVDPLVAALASIDIGLSDIELQKLKDMGVAVTAPARGGDE